MSSPNRLPDKYYRRRRIAAVLILLIIAMLIIAVVRACGGKDDRTAERASQSTSVSAPPVTMEESESTEQSPTSSVKETEEKKTTCELGDLSITASADQASYAAGSKPTFYMAVANPTTADCTIDLDKDILRFEVYDLKTNNRVWSDVDCHQPVETGKQDFKAGETRYFEAVWSRADSAPKKCKDRQPAPAGSYFLHAVIGDNPSDSVTFNLR